MGSAPLAGDGMRTISIILCAFVLGLPGRIVAQATADKARLIVVVGAAGEEEYGSNFVHSAELWAQAGKTGSANVTVIGTDPTNATTDFERLKQALAAEPKESVEALWLCCWATELLTGRWRI